ncbi:4-coumarate-CoA ligase 2 [Diplocarpon rosae]|nr:4-coumarate-CoA ligase 2 [Diplocarpon rosae]
MVVGGLEHFQHFIESAKSAHGSSTPDCFSSQRSCLSRLHQRLLILLKSSLHRGSKVTLLPGVKPETFLNAIQAHKLTFTYLIPPIILFRSKSRLVTSYDLSSLKTIASATTPLTLDLIESAYQPLKIPTKPAWETSEASPPVRTMLAEDWRNSVGSVRRILPNRSISVVSKAGDVLPPGKNEEIWVRGPNIFPGYLNNPTATAVCMTDGGHMKTGEIGHLTAEEYVYLTDRLKELTKYEGYRVVTADLEGMLLGHEMVGDANLLPRRKLAPEKGVEDEVLRRQIREWIHAKVANHEKLKGGVVLVDEIPTLAAGKDFERSFEG